MVLTKSTFSGLASSTALIHWGRVTHMCVSELTIIGSDNGLSPGRRQAIIWTREWWNIVNWTLRNKLQWNFIRNSNIFIQQNALENVVCEMASICLGLNVLIPITYQASKFLNFVNLLIQETIILQKKCHFPWITFIFDGCHCSWDAVKPVKYECDIQ